MMDGPKNIREAVQQWNEDCRTEAAIDIGVGLVSCVVIFGVIYGVTWQLALFTGAGSPATIASVITAIFFVVATWSAIRGSDPIAGMKPLSDAESARREIARVSGQVVGGLGGGAFSALTSHGRAGIAVLLIDSPRRLVDGIRNLRSQVEVDAQLNKRATKVLRQCDEQRSIKADPRAVFLLVQLRLVSIEAVDADDHITLKVRGKGRELLERLPQQQREQSEFN